MKNTKKIISLVLAICMLASLAISASAANTVDASGGTGTSSVTLSSTADGSIGGDPAATKMSVTVPTVLPIAVGTDGTVSTATDAKIVNNSFGAVKVNSVSIEAAQGWSLAAFGDKATLAHEKVNSNKFGLRALCSAPDGCRRQQQSALHRRTGQRQVPRVHHSVPHGLRQARRVRVHYGREGRIV